MHGSQRVPQIAEPRCERSQVVNLAAALLQHGAKRFQSRRRVPAIAERFLALAADPLQNAHQIDCTLNVSHA